MTSAFNQIHKAMYAELQEELRGWRRGDTLEAASDFHRATDEMLALRRCEPGTLSGTALVTLTTLCAMEWLRHRKAAVAAADESGDYSSLITEFVAWLRMLLASWREAVSCTDSARPPRTPRSSRRIASRYPRASRSQESSRS